MAKVIWMGVQLAFEEGWKDVGSAQPCSCEACMMSFRRSLRMVEQLLNTDAIP